MVVTSSRLAADQWVDGRRVRPADVREGRRAQQPAEHRLGRAARSSWPRASAASTRPPARVGLSHRDGPAADQPPRAARRGDRRRRPSRSSTTRSRGAASSSRCAASRATRRSFATTRSSTTRSCALNGAPGDLYGFVNLAKRAEPTVNDFVSIIQHPQGGPKKIAFTDNKVSAVFNDLVQYSTDTEPGSSGSPVFNQDWEIVGLHHRGGGLAGPDGKKYFTNEAIQIGSVVRDAASFLGVSDELYDLAFGDLRAALASLVNVERPAVGSRRRGARPARAPAALLLRAGAVEQAQRGRGTADGADDGDRRRRDRRRAAPVGAHGRARVDPGRGARRDPAPSDGADRARRRVQRHGLAAARRLRRAARRPARAAGARRRDRRGGGRRGRRHRRGGAVVRARGGGGREGLRRDGRRGRGRGAGARTAAPAPRRRRAAAAAPAPPAADPAAPQAPPRDGASRAACAAAPSRCRAVRRRRPEPSAP